MSLESTELPCQADQEPHASYWLTGWVSSSVFLNSQPGKSLLFKACFSLKNRKGVTAYYSFIPTFFLGDGILL